jgi:hypothetical protein
LNEQSNTRNPTRVVIRPTPKPSVYTRDDFTRDLAKVSKKPVPPKGK